MLLSTAQPGSALTPGLQHLSCQCCTKWKGMAERRHGVLLLAFILAIFIQESLLT